MTTPAGWFPEPTPGPDGAATERSKEIEPWALLIALVPVVGIAGGALAMARGKQLTGFLMIAVGVASTIILQTYRLALA